MNNGDTELLIYNHFGIKTDSSVDGEINFEKFGLFFTDHENNPFGVQWMRYTDNCKLPQLVKSNSHLGFQVKNLNAALAGRKIIIEPNSPSEGICVAFIEENGLPVELMEYN
ncbi:MAG: hypothetical protein JXR48_11820 [Candidatus Delongbacteria bacterium]|nr:hypothetical protein [Candidatus Delongbacteria bacterium]MBN2835639.1 hypothetical protein [Candidatus Delongbacteria bacterium]